MWILKFLPDWIFYLVLVAGLLGIAASLVLKFIPFVSQYRVPIQVAGGILTVIGLYMAGAISNNNAWLTRVSDLERQIAIAEVKSAAANTELTGKIATQEREIAVKQTELRGRIQQVATVIDAGCIVTPDVIGILNDAAARSGAKK